MKDTIGGDGPGPCPRCEAVRGATHGARHFWAGLALAGACAEATRLAADYVDVAARLAAARLGREQGGSPVEWLEAAAADIAGVHHARGWRAL